jgi:hypothetical protein
MTARNFVPVWHDNICLHSHDQLHQPTVSLHSHDQRRSSPTFEWCGCEDSSSLGMRKRLLWPPWRFGSHTSTVQESFSPCSRKVADNAERFRERRNEFLQQNSRIPELRALPPGTVNENSLPEIPVNYLPVFPVDLFPVIPTMVFAFVAIRQRSGTCAVHFLDCRQRQESP